VDIKPLPETLSDLLTARIHVAFLGEVHQFGWWPTSFFSANAKTFLEPIFSRTLQLARYHGAVEAASREHDDHLSTSAYHLFRLPEEVEADLGNGVRAMDYDQFAPRDQAASLDALRVLAGAKSDTAVGPVAIGKVGDIFSHETARTFARIYYAAFSTGTRAYPYLVH
jgi:hypothetical protein